MDANNSRISYARETAGYANSPVRQRVKLTTTGAVAAGHTVTLGTKTYTFRANVGLLQNNGDVLVGATGAASIENLLAAINLDPDGVGIKFAANTTAHTRVFAETSEVSIGEIYVRALIPGAPAGLVKATRVLTFTGQPANADTVTIDGKGYTFQTVLTNVDGNVFIGASLTATIQNLADAIMLAAGAGVDYAAATVLHPTVEVSANDATTLTARAKTAGTAGNAIVVAETSANASWASGTLTGGTDDTIVSTETSGGLAFDTAILVGGSGTPPTLKELPFTGESLTPGKQTVVSEEIRADRNKADLVLVGLNSVGQTNHEIRSVVYEELILAALLASAWTEAGGTEELSINGQSLLNAEQNFGAIASGARYIKVSGFASAENNGVKKIVSVVNNVIVCAPGSFVADETANPGVWKVRYARVGTTMPSFILAKEFLGLTPTLSAAVIGAVLNQMDVTLDSKSIAKIAFSWMGARQLESPGVFGLALTPTVAATNPILNTTSNVGTIQYGGSAIGIPVTQFTLNVNNNLRERPQIGSLITDTPGKGSCDATGKLTAYFKKRDLLRDFLNHASRSIEIPLIDADGAVINFYIPAARFTTTQNFISGINTDVMVPLDFQAVLGKGTYMLQIDALQPA